MALEALYTVAQVAEVMGVTARTVYRWIDGGRLEAVKTAGGQWRVTESALEAFVKDEG